MKRKFFKEGLCSKCVHHNWAKFQEGETKHMCEAFRCNIETPAVQCTEFWDRGRDKYLEEAERASTKIDIILPDKYSGGGYL